MIKARLEFCSCLAFEPLSTPLIPKVLNEKGGLGLNSQTDQNSPDFLQTGRVRWQIPISRRWNSD
jgi:hypothetical protein